MLRRTLGADIELVTLPALEACPVRVDPSQLDQVLLNLAVNARDAMPGGGILTFEVAPARLDAAFCRGHPGATPGACAHLRVSDTGTGMSEETQRRIFEPFFTTKETGKGTGLGLATVYGIVKQNEGTIWCRSEEGRGTTFDIYLPHAEGPIEPIPRRGTSGKMLACGTETILVVEDEPNVRRVAVSVLRRQGYIVVEAENGEEALRLIEAEPARFRLVLTDVVMPRMGGKALAEAMRELTPEILVIYMSGYTDDEIVHHGVQGVSFLPKPFEVPALLQMVRSLLDAHPRAGA
jgi:CheY-like chemotaxis protein